MTEWKMIGFIGGVDVYRRAGDVVCKGRRYPGCEYEFVRDGKTVAVIPLMREKDARVKYNAMATQQRTIERMKA